MLEFYFSTSFATKADEWKTEFFGLSIEFEILREYICLFCIQMV
jgi:hypothetical protein